MSIKKNIKNEISKLRDNIDYEFEIIKNEIENLESLFSDVKDFINECDCEETKEYHEIDDKVKEIEKITNKILMDLLKEY